MKKFILGKKVGMTQIFNKDGVIIPVTVVEAGPCTIIQNKTIERDGYKAVRVGFVNVPEKKLNKPEKGIFLKLKISPFKYLKEFRVTDDKTYEVGQQIVVQEMFKAGDMIDVTGISKGKGFQGTIKRYGQSGGDETHGSMYHRRPGSMGSNTTPARVFKGKKLPGHMGVDQVTIQNLAVVNVDAERNLLLIRGAIPGPKGGLVIIKDTVKTD